MVRKVLGLLTGVVLVTAISGCDEETMATFAPVAAKVMTVAPMSGGGDLLMDQVRLQSRLRDGSCDTCPNPDGSQSKYQYGRWGSGSEGNGQGDHDRDRLRDGSCGG